MKIAVQYSAEPLAPFEINPILAQFERPRQFEVSDPELEDDMYIFVFAEAGATTEEVELEYASRKEAGDLHS